MSTEMAPLEPAPAERSKGLPRLIVAVLVIAALGYFGYSKYSEHQVAQVAEKKDQLATQVVQSMQKKLNTDADFSKYDMHVDKVVLTKESDNKYNGIATVSTKTGPHDVFIDVTEDEQSVMWQSQTGAFLFLAQEQLAR